MLIFLAPIALPFAAPRSSAQSLSVFPASAFSTAIGHDDSGVCNMMSAFINNVQAQAGLAITTAEAAPMTGAAMQVKATIGCFQ